MHLTTSSDLSENVHEKLRAHQKKDWHAAPGSVARRLARRLDGSSRPSAADLNNHRRLSSAQVALGESTTLAVLGRFSSTYLIQHHQENEKKQKPPYHAKGQPPAIFFCSCLFGSRSEIRPPAAGRLSSKRFPHLIWSNTYHQKSEKEQKPPYAEETEWLSSFFPDPIYRKQNTFY